jgi:hypothetical protein
MGISGGDACEPGKQAPQSGARNREASARLTFSDEAILALFRTFQRLLARNAARQRNPNISLLISDLQK